MNERLGIARLALFSLALLEIGGAAFASDRPPHAIAAIGSIPGVENAFRLSPNVYSGGSPVGESAFHRLRELGVRTIVSVDGAAPDVETAKRYGIEYVHVPLRYSGLEPFQLAQLAKVAKERPGPFLIHCHHGRHRGPAAAAIVCMSCETNWTPEFAKQWLQRAGTSPDYVGLFEAVVSFRPPNEDERAAAPPLVSRTPADPLTETMIRVDELWERMASLAAADLVRDPDRRRGAIRDGLLLREEFAEYLRSTAKDRVPADVRSEWEAASAAARKLHLGLAADRFDPSAFESALAALKGQCFHCHKRFRDPPARPAANRK